jgi:hypothetical protein
MKNFLIWFYSCAFGFLNATQSQESPHRSYAVISIESTPAGLPIFIDGSETGFTPLQNYPLLPGKHEIAVKRALSESWLDFDWTETCSLRAGDTLKFVARFQKGYSINSTPFGAEVFVNEILRGTTPLVLRIPEGEMANVEIRKAGFQTEQLQIGRINENFEELRLHAMTLKPLALTGEVQLARQRWPLSRHRRISLAAAGVSLASGITAILLKDKADGFYDQYLTASLPEKRETFYKRTQDYDRYAGIATAVFEASFAVSFYFFLKSTSD